MPIEPRELEREGPGLEEGETREETKLREFMVLSSPVEPSRIGKRRGRGRGRGRGRVWYLELLVGRPVGRDGAWWVGRESRKSLVPLLWGPGLGLEPTDADWDGSSTAVSVCRHTADNVADGSSRLPSEGGLGVAAAESEVVGLEDRAGQGRNGRRSGWLSG